MDRRGLLLLLSALASCTRLGFRLSDGPLDRESARELSSADARRDLAAAPSDARADAPADRGGGEARLLDAKPEQQKKADASFDQKLAQDLKPKPDQAVVVPKLFAPEWVKRFGGPSSDFPAGLAVDAAGNSYLIGVFFGTVDFGGGARTAAGGADIFVASYDKGGAHRWSKSFGSTGDDRGHAIAVDAQGDLYLTGHFNDTVSFGGPAHTAAGSNDLFVASLAGASGAHRWSRACGTNLFDEGDAIGVDGKGSVFVAAHFQGSPTCSGTPLVSAGSNDVALMKLSAASGAPTWIKRVGGTGTDLVYDLVATSTGDLAVTGLYSETADFGGGPLPAALIYDIVLARYDGGSGAHLWSKGFGASASSSYDVGYGIARDGADNLYVTGCFGGSTISFGGAPLTSAPFIETEVFAASFSADGAHRWSTSFGSPASDRGQDVAVAGGVVFLTGYLQGAATIGSPLPAFGGNDAYVAALSAATGAVGWAQSYGGSGSDYGWRVAVDGTGQPVVTGSFAFNVSIGSTPLVSAGFDDIFLFKLVEP